MSGEGASMLSDNACMLSDVAPMLSGGTSMLSEGAYMLSVITKLTPANSLLNRFGNIFWIWKSISVFYSQVIG